MVIDAKPEGYIFKAIPKGIKEASAQTAQARVTQTVKSAIQDYLEQYLSPTGIYRNQLKLTAGFSIQYETGISFGDSDDPSIYAVQLARRWQELRMKLPAILIIDAGFNYINSGLSGLSDSAVIGRSTSAVYTKLDCSLPIKVLVGAIDETTCSDLRDILVYIFGTLTNVNRAHLIMSKRPEDSWEIRLPLNFTPEALDHNKIGDDPKDSMYSTGIEIVPEFEGTIQVGIEKQVQPELYQIHEMHEGEIPSGLYENGQLFSIDNGPRVQITVPEIVYLNSPTMIAAPSMPAEAYFASDDPKIALVDGYKILPKRPGTFHLYLSNKRTGDVIESWDVEVKIQ